MDDIFVGRLMSSPVRTVRTDATAREAARSMTDHDIGSIVVVDDQGALAGIATSTDFVRLVMDGRAASEATVAEYMSTAVRTATVNDPIRKVADAMIDDEIHHVPVVDDVEGVVGMVTTQDLTSYLSHLQSPSPAQ